MNAPTRIRILGATIAAMALLPRAVHAQAPVSMTPAPGSVATPPAPRHVYVRPARRHVYAAPVRQCMYVPAVRTYYTPMTSFGRSRRAVDAVRRP